MSVRQRSGLQSSSQIAFEGEIAASNRSENGPENDPQPQKVGPELDQALCNQFVSKVLGVHVLILIVSTGIAFLGVLTAQDQNFSHRNEEQEEAHQGSAWDNFMVAVPYMWGAFLAILAIIPIGPYRGPKSYMLALLTAIMVSFLIMYFSARYRSALKDAWLNATKPDSGNAAQQLEAKEREAMQKSVSIIFATIDNHVMKGYVALIMAYLSVIIHVLSPKGEFLSMKVLVTPVIFGFMAVVYICRSFSDGYVYNSLIGSAIVLLPALYTFRLQRWVAGLKPCPFNTHEWFDASINLFADTVKIIWLDLVDE